MRLERGLVFKNNFFLSFFLPFFFQIQNNDTMQSLWEFQEAKKLWARVLFYFNVAGRLHDLTSHISYKKKLFFMQAVREI